MPSTSLFTKTLGSALAAASDICTVTTTGTDAATGKIGFTLSVVQTEEETGVVINRSYRVDAPYNGTLGTWKRLAPYDKTEKFLGQNHWAVDVRSSNSVVTLRLVRTKVGDPPSTTVLDCKLIAYASVLETVTIENSTATDSNVTNAGVFDGVVLTQMDGKLAVNGDDPNHTLDVSGNVNATGSFKILGTDVISGTALGSGITGTLGSLSVTGNVTAGNLSTNAISATAITGTNLQVTGNVSGNLRVVGEIVSVGNVEIRYPVDESKRWRIISSTDATEDFLQIESLVGSVWTGYMRIDK